MKNGKPKAGAILALLGVVVAAGVAEVWYYSGTPSWRAIPHTTLGDGRWYAYRLQPETPVATTNAADLDRFAQAQAKWRALPRTERLGRSSEDFPPGTLDCRKITCLPSG